MLILSRKLGQKVIINGDIELTILDMGNNNVKIGIHAPVGVKIYRDEIYQAVKQANMDSNEAAANSVKALNDVTTSENSIVEKS